MISSIILSAGFSQRFGSPKALAQISENQKVIERIQQMLLQTKVDETIIVLGHEADAIKPFLLKHKNIKVVYNNHYNFGQTSSVKVGLKAVSSSADGVLLLPVDYPCIDKGTISKLIDGFNASSPLIFVPSYESKKGHPPLFSKKCFDAILKLDNESGLNTILHQYSDDVSLLPVVDKGILRSFNTIDEFNQIKSDFTL